MIDEAQHIGATGSGRKTSDQLNHIKSIANLSKITHVLCGTYELASFLNLNGQLARRSVEIHLERYRCDRNEDIRIFQNILWDFQRNIPLKESPDLVDNWEYFYERTLGCVGILHEWLVRALKSTLQQKKEVFTQQTLGENALSLVKCETIFEEIKISEDILSINEGSCADFRKTIGLDWTEPLQTEKKPVQVFRDRSVGVRKAKRDPIKKKVFA